MINHNAKIYYCPVPLDTSRTEWLRLSAQYGLIIKISKHWSIDNFIGVGVRTNHTIYSQVLNERLLSPNEALQYTGGLSRIYGWRFKGDITLPHFDIGVRILYQF